MYSKSMKIIGIKIKEIKEIFLDVIFFCLTFSENTFYRLNSLFFISICIYHDLNPKNSIYSQYNLLAPP